VASAVAAGLAAGCRNPTFRQAACLQVGQVQSAHTQFAQLSVQLAHVQVLWLHVTQVQSAQTQVAHTSLHAPHAQMLHSS